MTYLMKQINEDQSFIKPNWESMITTVAIHEIDWHQKNVKKLQKNFVVSFFYCIFVLRKEKNNKNTKL